MTDCLLLVWKQRRIHWTSIRQPRQRSVRVYQEDHQRQRRIRKVREKTFKRSNRLPRNRVDTSMDSRGKPPGKTQHKKQLSSRQPRANFSTADVIKEIRSSEVYVQCTCCSKRSTLGTVFCRCGKKLGGWTAVQEKNAQVIIDKGCQSIQSLVQLRITEQVRRGHGT